MELIAVLDLMGGRVVRARRGERSRYRPIESRLCRSAEVLEVAAALLGGFGLRSLYVADLDAILGRGDNRAALHALREAHPGVAIWVDAGVGTQAAHREALEQGCGIPVVGSESLRDCEELARIRRAGEAILSLDFRGEHFLGPPELPARADLWPARLIAMNLERVGAEAGPDLRLLRDMRMRAPDREVFAAGGVRDRADLDALRQAGAAGVLLASAFHDGTLTATEAAAYL